jgi:hypothetical protein
LSHAVHGKKHDCGKENKMTRDFAPARDRQRVQNLLEKNRNPARPTQAAKKGLKWLEKFAKTSLRG